MAVRHRQSEVVAEEHSQHLVLHRNQDTAGRHMDCPVHPAEMGPVDLADPVDHSNRRYTSSRRPRSRRTEHTDPGRQQFVRLVHLVVRSIVPTGPSSRWRRHLQKDSSLHLADP